MEFKKALLTALFASSIVVANITGTKLASVPRLGVAVPAGVVAFGVAFLIIDITSEWYGKGEAYAIVNASILAMVVAWMLVGMTLFFPPASFYQAEAAYQAVIGQSFYVIGASIVTMTVSQNIDVHIFNAVRRATNEKYKFLRNFVSTSASQLIDSVLFIGLAFVVLPALLGGGILSLHVVLNLIAGQYIAKVVIAVLSVPFFYLATMETGGQFFGMLP